MGRLHPLRKKVMKSRQDKAKRRQGASEANPHAHLATMDAADLHQVVKTMEEKYVSLCEEHDKMISEGKKQQQAFIRREVQYKSQIKRMGDLLDKAVLSRGGDEVGMPRIRETHKKIMEKLEEMQKGTRSVLQRHEQEMLSVFRSRLFEVEEKLKKNTAKKNTDTVGGVPRLWLDKAAKLSRELDHYKEESIRLDAENERLTKESNRLQAEHRSHQDDLTYLESQMAALKKENFKLKKDLEEAATVVPYLLPLPVSVS
mmetsp:Transcript_19017/g.29688  ORF Transcript_19017/g.29688 Transcript_19017/m.29688 type:complete len:258 (+) Transcript_19017:2-775(+)